MNKEIAEKLDKITVELYKTHGTRLTLTDYDIVKLIIKFTVERTVTNLCTNCTQEIPTCKSGKLVFGEGFGNDNVIECCGFKEKAQK